tara:strand:+ start:928 stop:1188 length:261 start_codon:yes stop_codon:yes gene_type:complete
LYLNVFAPLVEVTPPPGGFPVMVFLYGGTLSLDLEDISSLIWRISFFDYKLKRGIGKTLSRIAQETILTLNRMLGVWICCIPLLPW